MVSKSLDRRTEDVDRLLSGAAYWVDDCLQQKEAVVVAGGWLLLERARRWLPAWEGRVVTTKFASLHHRVWGWSDRPDQALLCTPRWLLEEGREVIATLRRPLSVVLLESGGIFAVRKRQIVSALTDLLDSFAVLDIPAETKTIWDAEVASEPAEFRLLRGELSKQWVWLL